MEHTVGVMVRKHNAVLVLAIYNKYKQLQECIPRQCQHLSTMTPFHVDQNFLCSPQFFWKVGHLLNQMLQSLDAGCFLHHGIYLERIVKVEENHISNFVVI